MCQASGAAGGLSRYSHRTCSLWRSNHAEGRRCCQWQHSTAQHSTAPPPQSPPGLLTPLVAGTATVSTVEQVSYAGFDELAIQVTLTIPFNGGSRTCSAQ